MAILWEQEFTDLLVVNIRGKLIFSEFKKYQSEVEPILHKQKKINYLVILEDFDGWDTDEGWNDMSFVEENDQYLSHFAIVGDEKWRDEVSVFMMIGLRSVDIRYFTTEDEARMWLPG